MHDIRSKVLWWAVKRRVALDKPFIIAITGSIAKTSTKMAVGSVLKKFYGKEVRIGFGNLNSFLGVPLAILGFEIDFYKQKITWQWVWILIAAFLKTIFGRLPKYLVLEYGADHPGDIKALAGQLPLDVAVITFVGAAHLENYSDISELAAEKSLIVTGVKKTGFVLINKDDPYSKTHRKHQAEFIEVETDLENMAINFARMLANKLSLDKSLTEDALSAWPRPQGRLQLKDLGSVKLLDDSYNANPASMEAAFRVLSRMPGRKVAILGDMLELGDRAVLMHQQVGKEAREVADVVIGVGPLSINYQPDRHFNNSEQAAQEILTLAQDDGSILVKGSHGIHMDKIVKSIINHFSKKR